MFFKDGGWNNEMIETNSGKSYLEFVEIVDATLYLLY